MASKAGSTDRRMVHKRGHDKQTWHVKASSLFSRVCEIKTGKIGLFYSRISEFSQAEGRQYLGTICPAMISIHYGDSSNPRSWSSVASSRWKEGFFKCFNLTSSFFCVHLLLIVDGMQHLVCMVWWMHENTFVIHLSIFCWLSLIPNQGQGGSWRQSKQPLGDKQDYTIERLPGQCALKPIEYK